MLICKSKEKTLLPWRSNRVVQKKLLFKKFEKIILDVFPG